MKLTRKQHMVLDLINASLELKDAEEKVKEIGGVAQRMAMVEAHDRFKDLEAKVSEMFEDLTHFEDMLTAGRILLSIMKEL